MVSIIIGIVYEQVSAPLHHPPSAPAGMLIHIVWHIIAPAANMSPAMRCPNLWRHIDGPTVSGCAQFTSSGIGIRHCHHLLAGNHCGHYRRRTGPVANVRFVFGKKYKYRQTGRQPDFHFNFPFPTSQGIHTMLPISWPVSVVLALFMTAIHIIYRIGTSPEYTPNFPMVSLKSKLVLINRKIISGRA